MSVDKDVLRVASSGVLLFATLFWLSERRIVRRLLAKHARHPDQALALPGIGPLERWVVRRLVRSGAVRNTANWRYYLVSDRYSELRKRRRQRALGVIALALSLTLAVWLLRFAG